MMQKTHRAGQRFTARDWAHARDSFLFRGPNQEEPTPTTWACAGGSVVVDGVDESLAVSRHAS